MARFSGNLIKNPLAGNEIFPATDPTSGLDIGATPVILSSYVAQNLPLANGSTNGAMTGAQATKLNALPTAASLSKQIGELGEVAIPVFVATPTNGSISIYQHVLDVPWTLAFAYASLSAGSTNVTITKNGVNIAGFTSVAVGNTSTTMTGTDTPANMTFNQQDVLGFTLAGTTGGAANLLLSIRANATIAP